MKRRWLFWLMVIAFLGLLVSRLNQAEKLAQTLAQGQGGWILLAALLQVTYYVLNSALYQSAFATVEVESHTGELLPVMFATVFVNTLVPGGGAALFVDDATRRGQSAARATAGTLLSLVAEFSTFLLILVVGLGYLFVQRDLKPYEIAAALVLLVGTAGLSEVLLLGLWRPERLRALLAWIQRTTATIAGRLRQTTPFGTDWADRTTSEFVEAGLAIVAHPARLARTLAVALLAHLVDVACLYSLFVAFRQPVGMGVLIAGYAMGVLFWLVAITPQGIGVVEGVMVLVYASLGVPTAQATVIALAYRGLGYWLPMAIGFVLLRRVRSFGAQERSRSEIWSLHAAALFTAAAGVLNVLSALTPSVGSRFRLLERFLPVEARHGARLAAALAGFALLMLARGLWRRKRVAWYLTIGVLAVSAASHLVKGLDYEEALLVSALLVWLWVQRAEYHARSDAASVWQGAKALLSATAFTMAYGVAGFYLLDRHFAVSFGLGAALKQTVIMFTQFYDPGLQPVTSLGRYFAGSIYAVGAVALSYGLVMLFRPVLVRQPASPEERERAKAVVEAHGRSSLARFTLLGDKAYYFSPGGSVVAYVLKGRIALALGDPIGPGTDARSAISGFRDRCARNDWQAAFYQTLPSLLPDYRAEGMDVLSVGQEAIVRLEGFELVGHDNKGLRSAVNRLTKLGYRSEMHDPPLPERLLSELRIISDEWLGLVQGAEKRFSLGWFEHDYIRGSRVMVVHDPNGLPIAFANVISEYQLNETSVDLMRHRRQVEHGVMEFLFVALFEWARKSGYTTFNLGLSALAGVGERSEDAALEHAMHYIYQHVDQFYDFQGLHQFKAKFHPEWSPRYLVYPGAASLPAVAIALIRADSGDGFVRSYARSVLEARAPVPLRD